MLHLLDANTLIDAKRDYYPIDRVPEFWDWLNFHGQQGNIKIPIEVYEECDKGVSMKKTLTARTRIFLSSILETIWAAGVGSVVGHLSA